MHIGQVGKHALRLRALSGEHECELGNGQVEVLRKKPGDDKREPAAPSVPARIEPFPLAQSLRTEAKKHLPRINADERGSTRMKHGNCATRARDKGSENGDGDSPRCGGEASSPTETTSINALSV